MDLFNGPQAWTINEQIIEDPASGLTFQFEVLPDGHFALRLFGDILPLGNRELVFDEEGREAGAGSVMQGPNQPTWHVRNDF